MFGQKCAMGTGVVLGLLVGLATLLGTLPVQAQQAPVNPQFIGDYDCGFSERMVGTLNNEIVQETWSAERDYNHRINPGSSGGVIDELAACTRLSGLLSGFSLGFQLPTIEIILEQLINQLIDAACSAVRRQIGNITSLFPSIPCYRGCSIGYGGYGLGSASGSAVAPASGVAAQGQSAFGGGTQLTPSQQWDSVRSLFQAEPVPMATAPAGSEQPR